MDAEKMLELLKTVARVLESDEFNAPFVEMALVRGRPYEGEIIPLEEIKAVIAEADAP